MAKCEERLDRSSLGLCSCSCVKLLMFHSFESLHYWTDTFRSRNICFLGFGQQILLYRCVASAVALSRLR